MAALPPYYDDVRWPGADGLRVPQEASPATLTVKKQVTLSSVTGSVTLSPQQAGGNYFEVTNTGATTLIFPSLPGHEFTIANLSGSSSTTTPEVSGQSASAIAVSAGYVQKFVISSTLGVIPAAAAVAI